MSDQVFSFVYSEPIQQRLDKFLVICLPDYSRSRLQGLIKDGFVRINGVLASKGGQSIEAGAQVEVRIPPPVPSDLIPENIPLQIIYENKQTLTGNPLCFACPPQPWAGTRHPAHPVRSSPRTADGRSL